MKKVIITLGFAAAAILAANAQEIPAAEEQPQTTVQTQPAPQNETLDSDTQPMDDRAVNDTYDNEVTEPETQTVRDEIDQTPTEPMQDSAVDEYPLQEETDAYDQPSTTNPVDPSVTTPSTTTPSTTDPSTTIDEQSSVGAPIDETQEEVVEMQGEDPNAQSSSNTQDQGEANTEEPMTQPTDQTAPGNATQPEQDQPQDDASAMNDSEKDVKTISESELPEEVSQAFQDSEYANASIEKVYMLEEDAVNKLLQNNAEQIYAGDQNPDKIYQLQVKGDEGQTILYYDENGDLMGSASI
jgi:hypothetical protein